MSAFMDKIVDAVISRIEHMSPSSTKRRSPRPYTKRLKRSSRTVPGVALPTGPMPEDPWYDPEEEAPIPLIGEAILTYHREHAHRVKMSAYQADRAIASFLTVNRLHENEPIYVITREHCQRLRAALVEGTYAGVGVNRNKKKAGPVTIMKRLKLVSHWMAWCVQKEWMAENFMAGLSLPARLVSDAKTQKTSLTESELSQVIPALLAMPADDLPRTEFKWLALGLMFTGARCMEIQQLRFKDVKQSEGVWCFDLNPAATLEGKMKTNPSVRIVPIHTQLIELGFLEWLNVQPHKNDTDRIFPLIHPKGSSLPSLWFSRLLRTLNMKRPETSLHSLRHSMTVFLTKLRTHTPTQNRLLGHALGTTVEERVYLRGLTFSAAELSLALEKVRFPVP